MKSTLIWHAMVLGVFPAPPADRVSADFVVLVDHLVASVVVVPGRTGLAAVVLLDLAGHRLEAPDVAKLGLGPEKRLQVFGGSDLVSGNLGVVRAADGDL